MEKMMADRYIVIDRLVRLPTAGFERFKDTTCKKFTL